MATPAVPKPLALADRFSKNFLELRTTTKLTQLQVAKKTGLSVSYISMLERGTRTPPLDMVDLIARKMKVDPLSLLKA